MEKQHPLNELLGTAAEKLRVLMGTNTIVGEPIQTGEVTLIPISRLSFGVASGGSQFATKVQREEDPFGGGSGAGAKVEPVAFLIIRGDSVKLLPVNAGSMSTVDRVVEVMPEVVDKVTAFWDKQQEKKAAREDESPAE